MIKVGDKVMVWNNMKMTGVVLELIEYDASLWFVGGTSNNIFYAKVDFGASDVHTLPVSELMRTE
jgi:hypothetical protein|tara:strand:- start:3125 stop:3319 length:195 start_codon:yes stop_codon:yes gene_type:complete